ncbi:S66 peptidase family protein [Croceibacterium ferulae]|uniref:S66 peptidase family protein n=1 Tax=Croceibacterium ferulae TaxID=1854641 RepID=UPI000EAFA79C|nr:LD-carboxypeptidase [Croceibacterium ferulae]
MEVSRRRMIAGLGAGGLLLGAGGGPLLAQGPALIRPPRLRPGDTVGLVAPAGFLADRTELDLAADAMRAMGLEPKLAANILDRHGYLAGTDGARAAGVNAMFADPAVRLVFSVRGGWGSARILPLLDYAAMRRDPKPLVGFSDVTALHLALQAQGVGFATIHGPNAASTWPLTAWEPLRSVLFDGATPTYGPPAPATDRLIDRAARVPVFGTGTAEGRLLGGNLTVLSALVGTPWLPDFTGAILFLEETNEAQYRIDRMLTQLGQAGILPRVAGVVFGQCTNCTDPGGYGNFTLVEVLDHHLGPLGIPAFQLPLFGHGGQQAMLPVGARCRIDAGAGTMTLLEPVVA